MIRSKTQLYFIWSPFPVIFVHSGESPQRNRRNAFTPTQSLQCNRLHPTQSYHHPASHSVANRLQPSRSPSPLLRPYTGLISLINPVTLSCSQYASALSLSHTPTIATPFLCAVIIAWYAVDSDLPVIFTRVCATYSRVLRESLWMRRE